MINCTTIVCLLKKPNNESGRKIFSEDIPILCLQKYEKFLVYGILLNTIIIIIINPKEQAPSS
jgi:hypothetical protein